MTAKTILIADDEPHLTSIVAFNLKKNGMTVHVAVDGEECCRLALAVMPDLIVSDFQMPVMDGLAACTALHDDPRTAAIPVIMLTARGHRVTPAQLAGTNIKALVPKPFSARDLVAKIQEIFAADAAKAAA